MRAPVAALLAVVAAVGIGCEPPVGRTFATEFPAVAGEATGSVDLAALPVRVHDPAGLLTGVEKAEARAVDGPPWVEISATEDVDDRVRVEWMGGACTDLVKVVIVPAGDGFRLELIEDEGLGRLGGCQAVGVFRAIVIRFTVPVDPDTIRPEYALP